MSRIRADKVTDRAGTGPVTLTYGADIVGVTTAAHLNVTGVTTATTFKGNLNVGTSLTITASGVNVPTGIVTASAAGGALATTINAKASTGKAIAMSMVFG